MSVSTVMVLDVPAQREPRGQVIGLWCLMTCITASAAILIRYCKAPASSIGFWRVFGASCVLMPWWVATVRRLRPRPLYHPGALLAGLLLGIHFATWAWAVQHATLANAALCIAMQPAVTPLIGHWLAGDRLNRWEYLGTALACTGMASILGGQVVFTPNQIAGSLVALLSMVCCAFYFVLGRRFRSREHVILFSVPVYLSAAAIQAIMAVVAGGGIHVGNQPAGWAALAGLILLPTVGGHTLAMYLLRHVKAHTITLSVPVQFVIITAAGTVLFREHPRLWFYPGAMLVLAGVILAIAASTRRPKA